MINVGGNRWAIALALLAALGLTGCPGDNAAPPPSQGTTITGSVQAPGGTLVAKAEPGLWQWFASLFVSESHAQGAPTLGPVPDGTRILVFQINDTGNPVTPTGSQTPILAQATTTGGNFSVTLPPGTALASNIIVQASPSGSPARVCDPSTAGCPQNQTQLNCPAVGTTLNINPAAELATRQILRRIAQAGGNLGNYTNGEVAAFVTLVQSTVASDPTLIAGNLTDTLTNIGNRVQGLIDDTLPGLESASQTNPTDVVGTYNFVGFQAEAQSTGTLRRAVEFGTVVLNSNGTFSVASQQQGGQLTESCSSSCSRTFTQSAINQTDTSTGTYVRVGNSRIIFTDPDGSSLVAFSNPSGNIVIVPFEDGEGFAIAVKQGSGLSTQTAQGTFNYVEFGSSLGSSANTNNSWSGPLRSGNGSGTATFAGNNVTITGNASGMGQQLTCTLTGTGCNLVAALGQQAENFNFPSSFFINPTTGTLTITDTDPGTTGDQTGIGEVSADGNYAIFPTPETTGGSLVVATRQPTTPMSNTSLTGTYNLIAFGDILTNTGDILTVLSLGTCRPDSIGKMGFQAINTVRRRTESCPSSGACSISSAPVSDATTFNENRDYTLAANGALTITSPAVGTLNGFVSPDASFLFLTNAADNDVPQAGPLTGVTNSRRFIAVAVKQS